ncbi:MAG: hypothetical protein K2M90_05505, partial [Treponemataceae bacterium]|nr:hypothetical protein [Treponemataceae bacterium]
QHLFTPPQAYSAKDFVRFIYRSSSKTFVVAREKALPLEQASRRMHASQQKTIYSTILYYHSAVFVNEKAGIDKMSGGISAA